MDMAGRIFVTGDKHGAIFLVSRLAEMGNITKDDILLIAGDAGYVWDEDYPYMIDTLHQIFPGIIAFIDGNHENHAILNGLKEQHWNGGRVHQLGERVFHLMRGELYTIYGQNFFTFGGARSVDRDRRIEGESWWQEEEPSADELRYGEEMLQKHRDNIDYVITHEAPLFARGLIKRQKPIAPDDHLPAILEKWYGQMEGAPRFKRWFFGHMHVDQKITEKLQGVFNEMILL